MHVFVLRGGVEWGLVRGGWRPSGDFAAYLVDLACAVFLPGALCALENREEHGAEDEAVVRVRVDRLAVCLLEGGEGGDAKVEALPEGRADRVPVEVGDLRAEDGAVRVSSG